MIQEMFFVVAFYQNAKGLAELRVLSGPHPTLAEAREIKDKVWAMRLEMNYFIARVNLNIEIVFFDKDK